VLPDRFFWTLPPGEEGEAGPDEPSDDSIAPKNPRHVH
jgi:hydroxymethylpyrimidine/phosphomethylpyrimidine kinase